MLMCWPPPRLDNTVSCIIIDFRPRPQTPTPDYRLQIRELEINLIKMIFKSASSIGYQDTISKGERFVRFINRGPLDENTISKGRIILFIHCRII